MKKVIYLTVFANPFQYEFTNAVKKGLEGISEFKIVYEKTLPDYRKHWGNYTNGETLGPELTFIQYLKKENPDVLVLTMYNSKITAVGTKWAKKNKKAVYFGPHEILKGDGIHPILKYLKLLRYKFKAKSALGIMTMGNQSVRELSVLFPQKKIISIPYSFDLTRIANFKNETQPGELVFLMSGGLYDFRNPLLGIRVFNKLVKNNPNKNLKLIISGQGPLYEECLATIDKLELKNKVSWQNDFTDWYDIHNIYKMANVLIALQKWGTWGIIIQEAMAAGMGIVATNTIQSADNFIINGYNGYLTTLKEDIILESLQYYVDDFELSRTHGQRNKKIVKEVDVSSAKVKFINFIKPSLI